VWRWARGGRGDWDCLEGGIAIALLGWGDGGGDRDGELDAGGNWLFVNSVSAAMI
jgi:hypothetical protein